MNKRDFPKVHFYDQDFVDIYDKTWNWMEDYYLDPKSGQPDHDGLFLYPEENALILDQLDSTFASFFLVYSNRNYPAGRNLDYFYGKQEEDGAIRWRYDTVTSSPVFTSDNPQGVGLPLFAWAEYNLFHKSANKRRVKEVLPILQKYTAWLDTNFKMPNGLYSVPVAASTMYNSPRDGTVFSVDFNAAMAVNALYLSSLGNLLNEKDESFVYKRMYFSLKTRINDYMWDPETSFYHDLDANGARLPHKTIAGFWPLLAEIPNEEKAESLISHLKNPATFGTEHPFPTLSLDHPRFSREGDGFLGGVYPPFNFMVAKGLERYQRWELARESAIRHLYFILDGFTLDNFDENMELEPKNDVWDSYRPCGEGPAANARHCFMPYVGLSTVAMMIENVVGIIISLPKKTVDWVIPNMEIMGIENLSLKRNLITILSNKSNRGWEILLESEKLYYFTINVLSKKKKTLPIPSGKCSMLVDKL